MEAECLLTGRSTLTRRGVEEFRFATNSGGCLRTNPPGARAEARSISIGPRIVIVNLLRPRRATNIRPVDPELTRDARLRVVIDETWA
jgi:hypothetical protein